MRTSHTDAVVVGSGPNGLAAAVVLARTGLAVELCEGADAIGGGLRSVDLFDTGVTHDVCSAVHPMAAAARFFREFDLAARGVELIQPEISYAHPLPDGRTGLAYPSLVETCGRLGVDGERWYSFMRPLLDRSRSVVDLMLSDQRHPPADAYAPLLVALRAFEQWSGWARFGTVPAAMLAGVAAHTKGALPSLPGGAVAVLLGHLAHSTGWPLPRGGSQRIADAMLRDFLAHGGKTSTGTPLRDIRQVADARVVLLDTGPWGFLRMAERWLPDGYRRWLESFRYGPGATKVDFLVSQPIPWSDPDLGRAGTVHIGGSRSHVFSSTTDADAGRSSAEPFVLLSEPANTDPRRARTGQYPVWAYCHVPNGDYRDMSAVVQRQIERYAPGFSDTVLERGCTPAAEWEAYNPNYVGGDIGVGAVTARQMVFRPAPRLVPHSTPLGGVYLCSAGTPPGPGVHGMGGYFAARAALRHEFGISTTPALGPDSSEAPH